MTTSATKMFLPGTEDNQFIPVLVTSNLREVGQARLTQRVKDVFAELTQGEALDDGAKLLLENLSLNSQKDISSQANETVVIALDFSNEKVAAMEAGVETSSISMADLKAGILLQLSRIKTEANAKVIEAALIKKNKLKAERAQEVVLEFAIRAYIHETILTATEQNNTKENSRFASSEIDFISEPKVIEKKANSQDNEAENVGKENTASPSIQVTPSVPGGTFESDQYSTGIKGVNTTRVSKSGVKSPNAENTTKFTMAEVSTEQKLTQQNDVPVTDDLVIKNNLNTATNVHDKPQIKQISRNKAGSNSGGSQVQLPISPIKFSAKQNNSEVGALKPIKLWTDNGPPEKFSPEYDAYYRMKKKFDRLEKEFMEQHVDELIEPTLPKNRAFSGRNNVKKRLDIEKEPSIENDQVNDPAPAGTKNRNNRNKKGKQAMAETNIQQDDLASSATNRVMADIASRQAQKTIKNLNLTDTPERSLIINDIVDTSKDGVVKTKEIIYKESHPFGDVVIKLTEEHYQGVRPDYNYGPFLSKPGEVVEATEKITGSIKSELINLQAKAPPYRFKSEVAAESLAPAEKAKVMERFHKALNELEQHNVNAAIKDINNANAKQPLFLDDQLTAVQKQLSGNKQQQDAIRNIVADKANKADDPQRNRNLDDDEPTL